MRRLDHMPSSGTGLDRSPHADDGGLDALVTEAGSRPEADYDLLDARPRRAHERGERGGACGSRRRVIVDRGSR